jgi:hypothetical protein
MMDGAKKEDIANFSGGFWKSKEANEAIMKFWGGDKIAEAAKNFGDSFVKDYSKSAEGKGENWLADNNAKAFVYLASNPAQEAGFSVPGGYAKVEDVRKFINDKKKGKTGAGPSPAAQKSPLVEAGWVNAQGRPMTEFEVQKTKETSKKEPPKEKRDIPRGSETGPRGSAKRPPGTSSGPERSDRRPPGT